MSYHLVISYLVAIVSLLPASFALPGWPSQGTIVDGSATLYARDVWEAKLANPNATGDYSIAGFDISQQWPSQQVDGWSLSINITGNISKSETVNPGSDFNKVITGTSIFLKAPESILHDVESNENATTETTWKICVVVMTGGPQEDPSTADNGTCGFLSTQCISEFQDAYAGQFAKNQDCYARPPATPSSCGNSIDNANLTVQQYPVNYLNGTEIFVYGSDARDASDNSTWNTAVRQVWPVLTIWGWNIRAHAPDGTQPTVELTCVRANSDKTGKNSTSSASESVGSIIIALGIAGATAMLLV